MSARAQPSAAELRLTQLLYAFAALSLALVCALSFAPLRDRSAEWRAAQARYNALARAARSAPVSVGIKQIWAPAIDVVDRCSSCHLGVEAAAPLAGERLFAAHPAIAHDPRKFGCTPCHGGEGRATSRLTAHGLVRYDASPLLERARVEAGCGTCHSHIPTPDLAAADQGRRLFEEVRCRDCHAGERDLRDVGLRGFPADWHARHAGRAVGAVSFAPLADEEIPPVAAYLTTLVGAPRLMEGKMLAASLGCRGCHRIQGVGGDIGPDLTGEGRRSLEGLDFRNVTGPRTLSNWLRAHFLDPQRVVRNSAMPRLGVTAAQADALTTYALSLRAAAIPLELSPPDRVRGVGLGAREFATDGASLYGAFCVACHGPRGEGAQIPGLRARVPALANPDFQAIADERLLRGSIANGRPGRPMPAWSSPETGLRPDEIDALVRYVRSFAPPALDVAAVMAEPVDADLGARLFAENCAGCHGAQGEGSVIAPPLGALDNQVTRADNPTCGTLLVGVVGTAMGSFRHLGARSLRALVGHVRSLSPSPMARTGWSPRPGVASRGEALFADRCVECHGRRGEGDRGPALRNPALLAAASDGYLTASIVRGFVGTDMPRWGTGDARHARLTQREVADLVALLRSWAPRGIPAATTASHAR